MSDPITAAAERIRRVKAGEEKIAVYQHPNPDAHEMVKIGHAEFSHYYDLEFLADAYLALGERQEDRLAIYKGSEHYCGPFENPDLARDTVEAYGNEFRLVRVSTFIREEGEGEGA